MTNELKRSLLGVFPSFALRRRSKKIDRRPHPRQKTRLSIPNDKCGPEKAR
jgi:hypothetical protein